MRRASKVALGCLLSPLALLVVALIFVLSARMSGVPEPSMVDTELGQKVPTELSAPNPSTNRTRLERRETAEPNEEARTPENTVRVVIELEEAEFHIEPQPAKDGIKVEAKYDESSYDLVQNYGVDKDGTPTYHLSFKARIHWLKRVLASGDFTDDDHPDNRIAVRLPVDTPMELQISLAKGQGKIDLTNLALSKLTTKLTMGEYQMDVDRSNSLDMSRFSLEGKMGEFEINGVSRLAARSILIVGGMGEMRVHFGGPLLRDSSLVTNMRMGEMSLRLPDNALWDGDGKAVFGEVTGGEGQGEISDPEGPRLSYRSRVSFGELSIFPYHVETPSLERRRD